MNLSAMFDRIVAIDVTRPSATLAAGIASLVALLVYLSRPPSPETDASRFLRRQQWVGLKKQRFPQLRATLRSIKGCQSMVAEGYRKFSNFGIPFVIPSMASEPTVVIGPSELHNVLDIRPDSEVEASGPQNETLQTPYTVRDKEVYVNTSHSTIVLEQLTRNIGSLTAHIVDEIGLAFKHGWSTSCEEWTTVKVWPFLLKTVARVSNRLFVGLPLCRNEKFLEYSTKYSISVINGACMINMFPPFLRPIAGSLVALASKRYLAVCVRICRPVILERLHNTQRKMKDQDFEWDPPTDALQSIINESVNKGDACQLDPSRLVRRLLMLNNVSVHSTSFTMTNAILDLYSSAPSKGFVDALREEADQVLAGAGGSWSKDAVDRMALADSTIRESMRLSDYGILALPRRVSAPEGVTLHNGFHIPKGVRLTTPVSAIHHDETFFPDPFHFDAFRFSKREPEAAEKGRHGVENATAKSNGSICSPTADQSSLVDESGNFLAFGRGKHACPGRFLASHLMKLMLAHIVQHYDVQYIEERPRNNAFTEAKLPSENAEIKVRRKKSSG